MPECKNCGSWVSERYARVMGIDGEVHACESNECGMTRDLNGKPRPRKRTARESQHIINESLPEVPADE